MKSSRNFNRFLQKPRFRVQCSDISPELATEIIEKELDLDKTVTLNLVQDLIALYTRAIEHYESQENPKYLDFQEKLQKMLVRPQVFTILNPKSPESSKRKSLSPCKYVPEDHRKNLSLQFATNLQSSNPMGVINSQSAISKETSENIKNVIKSQEKDLQSKLQARKNKKDLRSQNESLNNQVFPCDVSYVERESNASTKSSLICLSEFKEGHERFEKRLEGIMEKNFNELTVKIVEIRQKYEKEIEEFKNCDGFGDMIAKEMNKNMDREIQEIKEFYDLKRKNEILKAKEEINS